MSTLPVRTRVIEAFGALIDASEIVDAGGASPSFEYERDSATAAFPGLVVIAGPETHRYETYGRIDITMQLAVLGFVRVPAGPDNDEDELGRLLMRAINDLYAQVFGQAMADIHLGGLADNLRTTGFDPSAAADAAERTGGFMWSLEVDYWTSTDSAFSQTQGG